MTTTAARKLAVERLEESAFSNEYAHEDIFVLKQGVYAEAEKQQMTTRTQKWYQRNVYVRPQVPNANASAATLKIFTVFHNLYQRQDDALRALKQKVLNTLDSTTMDVVKDPEDGVLHKSVRDVLTELLNTCGTMTHAELHKIKLEWMALKWDSSDNLITILATFQRAIGFLAKHNNAPSTTEAQLVLQAAVENVPAFVQMAYAAFYQTYPLINDQTLAHLIVIYTHVYRSQNSTAANHHAQVSQVLEAPLDGIIATVQKTTFNPEQLKQLMHIINTKMQGSPYAPAAIPSESRGKKNGKTNNDVQQYLVNGQLPANRCPMHPKSTTHTWAQCKMNSNNKTK